MKKSIQIYNIISIVILLALSGCAHYKPKSGLRILDTSKVCDKKSTVSFQYRVFNKHDCIKYLDRNVIAMGYQPIQITLINNTNNSLIFSTASFSIPCVSEGEVAEKVHSNTKGRAAGYGAAAFFCWPFAIPAIVDGIGSSESNKKLDMDYSRKALCDQVVKPDSIINGLIFVPVNSFYPNFKFVLKDTKSNKKYILSPSDSTIQI